MDVATIQYAEQEPVLRSVFAYGSETLVPNHDISRLSYYLKCCIVGCGIPIPLNEALIDYQNAHNLPIHLQELIVRTSFNDLSLENLINRAFILDDQHTLLPQGTLNTFFEFKTASTYFAINNFAVAAGQQIHIHKVMLCTLKWMREYYIDPFIRYQQGDALVESHAVRVPQDSLTEDENALVMSFNQGIIVTTTDTPQANLLTNALCSSCNLVSLQGLYYRCSQCPSSNLCEQCYMAGQHDQTHSFERIRDNCPEPEPLRAQVEELTDRNYLVPDVPMAIAVPIDDVLPDGKVEDQSTSSIR